MAKNQFLNWEKLKNCQKCNFTKKNFDLFDFTNFLPGLLKFSGLLYVNYVVLKSTYIFVHFWNCKKWNLIKIKFREIDLFDFTSFLAWTFLNILTHCVLKFSQNLLCICKYIFIEWLNKSRMNSSKKLPTMLQM